MYPWGVPPRVSFRSRPPHLMPFHQSAPWVDSVKHAALPVVVHSALFSDAVQYGEFTPSIGVVRCTFDCPVRYVENVVASSPAERLSARPVPAKQHRGVERFGQAIAVGPPHRPGFGSRGASP